MTNLSALNEQQREAVVSEDKRLLVLAGAGSGKTKTLLQKIIYLIEEKGGSPLDILAITPETYPVRTGVPVGSVVEEVRLCPECSRQIEPVFAYCPYCGRQQANKDKL